MESPTIPSLHYDSGCHTGDMMNIQFNHYAKKIQSTGKRQWYKWKIFVDEQPGIINEIESVTYVLHPTFPNPIRIVTDANSKFALEESGWGSFTMLIRTNFKNGEEFEIDYFLDLEKSSRVDHALGLVK